MCAQTRLLGALEALLFVADAPVTAAELAAALEVPAFEVEEGLEKLGARLHHESGLQLVRIAGGYQMATKPEFAEAVARFSSPQRARLSRTLLEVLAIVAYQQPVTSSEIDAVRGVDSSYALRQLVERRLVAEVGRKQAPGRPMLYGTTPHFLHAFNLVDLSHLPPLDVPLPETVGTSTAAEQGHLPLGASETH